MSAQGVFTRNKRVIFVDGQETHAPDPGFVACGAGTAFPMQVTLDQLAEIRYRVKDAWFTAGSQSWTVGGNPRAMYAPTLPTTNRTAQTDTSTIQQRGYTILGANDYYGELYDAGYGLGYSDIADNERGMWLDSLTDAFTYSSDDPFSDHPNDYEWIGNKDEPPNAYGGKLVVFRGPRVAVVRQLPEDGFFAATNKFFLELEMYWYDYPTDILVPNFGASTNVLDSISNNGLPTDYYTEVCDYVIQLAPDYAGGPKVELRCPLYAGTAGGGSFTGEDWVHTAQEWWPYDRNATLRPIWESETGVFIPPGVPFLNMGDADETLPFPIFF